MLYSDEIYIEDFKRTYTEAYRKGFIDGFNERGYLLTYIGNDHIKAEQTEPNCSEKPNNCEHITEDGVTCAKYPACDDCLDNPLNKVKGSERLVKSSEQSMDCFNRIAGEIKQADTPQTMEGTTTANHFYGREGESK